jgi:hypothetical protein
MDNSYTFQIVKTLVRAECVRQCYIVAIILGLIFSSSSSGLSAKTTEGHVVGF